jgi:hypothetical protein
MLRAGLGGDNDVYGRIELGGRSGQTRALCGERRPAIRQTGSSNLEHAVDLGRGHAADGCCLNVTGLRYPSAECSRLPL